MKKIKKTIALGILIITMFITSYSQANMIGSGFSSNQSYQSAVTSNQEIASPPSAAVYGVAAAVCATYFTGYIVGTLARHVYNSFLIEENIVYNYNPNDFSSFDN